MIDYGQARPLKEAVEALGRRTPLGSAMRTAEWEAAPLEVRERAFFSASVEDVRFLEDAKRKLVQRLKLERRKLAGGKEGATMDRARFVAEMGDAAREAGLASGDGSLTDVGSARRLELIWDVQVRMAQGWAKHKMGLDPDVLDAVPAQELIRVEDRVEERDWPARWAAQGGSFFEGKSDYPQGRMVALKTDPIWAGISRFGVPFPPFDFGSGMGLRDVRRKEAEELGILEKGARVPEAVAPGMTEELATSTAGLSAEGVRRIVETFGDYVRVEEAEEKLVWDFKRASAEPPEVRALPVPARLERRRAEFLKEAGEAPAGIGANQWAQLSGMAAEVSTGQRPAARDFIRDVRAGAAAAERLRAASPSLDVVYRPEKGEILVTRKGGRA